MSMNFTFSGYQKLLGKLYKEFAVLVQHSSQTRTETIVIGQMVYLRNFLKHLTVLFFTIILHSYIYNTGHHTEILKDIINNYSLAAQIQPMKAFTTYSAHQFVLRSFTKVSNSEFKLL